MQVKKYMQGISAGLVPIIAPHNTVCGPIFTKHLLQIAREKVSDLVGSKMATALVPNRLDNSTLRRNPSDNS